MALSQEILSQFAKLVTKNNKTDVESTVYGTVIVDSDGNKYVKLDGSDQLTPLNNDERPAADSTTANFNEGERVSVLIKNHTATITGNVSSPAARTGDVEELGDQVTKIQEFDILIGEQIQAQEGYIQKLQTDKASVAELQAAEAKITELEVKKASVEELNAVKADITDLQVDKLDAEVADIKFATIENLNAANAKVTQLEAVNADITNKLTAAEAEIDNLEANKLSAKDADIKYANIDFANIGEAAIRKIFSDSGLIKDLIVGDGTITGELVGVTIKGDLIEGNTVKADKLVVKGSDGLYYKLNFESGKFAAGEVVPSDSLHGSVITAKSITAEKVSVKDLVAFGATIGGFKITGNSIYSGAKSGVNNTTRGIYLDNDGQMSIGDSSNYLKYYKDTDGTYKLAISAGSIILGSSNKSVDDVINEAVDNMKEELSNVEIGARNYIRNSENLIFENYFFADATITVTDDGQGNITITSAEFTTVSDNGAGAVQLDMTYLIEHTDDDNGNVILS